MPHPKTAFFTLSNTSYEGEVETFSHRFSVDEPESLGGKNKYPNPINYLLGSLASCTAITLKMYAERKEWDLGKIEISVELKEKLTSDGKKYVIKKNLFFGNKDLTEKQTQRLKTIADHCPVSKILTSSVELEENAVGS